MKITSLELVQSSHHNLISLEKERTKASNLSDFCLNCVLLQVHADES